MGKLSHKYLENKANGNTIANSRKNKIIQGGKCSHSIQFGSMVNKTYTVVIKHSIRLTKKCVTKIDGKREGLKQVV